MPLSATINGEVGVSTDDLIVGVGLHGIRSEGAHPFSRLGIYAMSPDGHLHFVRVVEFRIQTGDPVFKSTQPGSGSDLDRSLANWVSGALHNPDMGIGDFFPKFDHMNDGGFVGELSENESYARLIVDAGRKPKDFALERRLDARIELVQDFMDKSEHSRSQPDQFNGLTRIPIFVDEQISDELTQAAGALDSMTMSPEAFRECAFSRFRLALPASKDHTPKADELRRKQREVRQSFARAAQQIEEMWSGQFNAQMFETSFKATSNNLEDQVKKYLALYCGVVGKPVAEFDAKPFAANALMAIHSLRALFHSRSNEGVSVWSISGNADNHPTQEVKDEIADLRQRPMFTMVSSGGSGSIQVRPRFVSNGDFPFEGADIIPVS